jgi:hypothetical protein
MPTAIESHEISGGVPLFAENKPAGYVGCEVSFLFSARRPAAANHERQSPKEGSGCSSKQ